MAARLTRSSYPRTMRWFGSILMLATACGGTDPTGAHYEFVPFEGLASAPDAWTDRLCAEAADPDAAPDKVFIDCRVEGSNLAGDVPPPTDAVTVVAWNIERGRHLDQVIASLAGLDADVLLVSEADRGCARTDGANVPWEIAQQLGLNYAFAVEFTELPRPEPMGAGDDSCEHGNFVASRYPIGNVEAFRHADNLSWYDDPGEPRLGGRVAIMADVQVGDAILHATSVHFESRIHPIDIQVGQAAETAERALERPFAQIMGGDTNAPLYIADLIDGSTRDGTTQAFLSRGLVDTHDTLHPDDRATRDPGLIIDLMFTNQPHAQPGICAEPGCGDLSDHRAVWVDVTL